MEDCVYKGEKGECLLTRSDVCEPCTDFLSLDDEHFVDKYRDPLRITDRNRNSIGDSLCNMLANSSVFLACGGPSANDLPLEQLNRRGIWTMCVNNMAGHDRFRPQAFVCADPPSKFNHSIWLDPGIMKFVPSPKLRGYRSKLRKKRNGKFRSLGKKVPDCPNVWSFQRDTWLLPDNSFLMGNGARWGNQNAGVTRTGLTKTVSTMLLAIRILYHLGARTIYLVGVDFRMAPGKGYAFAQDRDAPAIASNNRQFQIISGWLEMMVKDNVFKRFGLSVYNCYERSGLRAFPYVPFEDAIRNAKGIIEDSPDLRDWYEPQKKK